MLDLKSYLRIGLLLVSMVSAAVSSHSSEESIVGNNAFSMQAQQSCPRAGACQLCQSFQAGSTDIHVCPDEGKPPGSPSNTEVRESKGRKKSVK